MRAGRHELLSELEEAGDLAARLLQASSVLPAREELPVRPPPPMKNLTLPNLSQLKHGEFGTGVWNAVLGWVQSVTDSKAAFLVDIDGLLIATLGAMDADQVESLAPRLISAMDQLRLMDQAFGSFEIISGKLGSMWLTGLWIEIPGHLPLTLGLLGGAPVQGEVKDAFQTLLAQAFG